MNYLDYSKKLDYLCYLIKSKAATNVNTLEHKLVISRRSVLRMVDTLRAQGKNIVYCKRTRQYKIEE
jgi:predicted DNA-binding transcriptional regulator YafY